MLRIKDQTLIRGGRVLAGTCVLAAFVSLGVIVSQGRWELFSQGAGHLALWAIGMGSLAWVTITGQARNGVVWAFVGAAFFATLTTVGLAVFSLVGSLLSFEEAIAGSPSELPVAAALALNPIVWAWMPAFVLVLTVGLLLFPDGRPPSPRWRWVAWLSVALMALAILIVVWEYRPSSTTPVSAPIEDPAQVVLLSLLAITVVASVVGLIVRYRRSAGVTRHQIRWIAWAGAFLAATLVLLVIDQETGALGLSEWSALLLLAAAEALLILSFAIAITKYRLYDIDLVISKTVTYGILAIFITAVYVAIVVGVGTLAGGGDEPNLALAIAATALVALLFEPLRSRLQRWANRLVYGERATPYEVLAGFSKRAASAAGDEEMLQRIPRLIVDGTGATKATLWTADGDQLQPAAKYPVGNDAAAAIPIGGDRELSDTEADYWASVEHDAELLGGLSLVAGRGATITPSERELVDNLAGGLGLALRNARLTEDLRDQVTQLAASRERILAAADDARRDLERDLDMGPQQDLVAVKVKLGVVKTQAEAADADQTFEVLGQLEDDAGRAIESVRDFARGVYPSLLEAEGLVAAVSAEADKAAFPVTIEADGVGRYSREVETAVFFSVLEALQNTAKYANASSAAVRLGDDGDRLAFEVVDDGTGFDPEVVGDGTGIPSMTDRLDAAGGDLSIDSAPGHGTSVSGWVPAR